MTARDFCYWLQGFVEVSDPPKPTEREWQIIKDHLKEVDILQKLTPYTLGVVSADPAKAIASLSQPTLRPLRDIPDSDPMNRLYC